VLDELVRIPGRKSTVNTQHGTPIVVMGVPHVMLHDIFRLGAETAILALFHLWPEHIVFFRHFHVVVLQFLNFFLKHVSKVPDAPLFGVYESFMHRLLDFALMQPLVT